MRKALILAFVLLLIPVMCSANWFTKGNCPNNYCQEYPQFKVTWFGPDGMHVWDRVCNLISQENGAYWTFCVEGKTIVVVGTITAEEL